MGRSVIVVPPGTRCARRLHWHLDNNCLPVLGGCDEGRIWCATCKHNVSYRADQLAQMVRLDVKGWTHAVQRHFHRIAVKLIAHAHCSCVGVQYGEPQVFVLRQSADRGNEPVVTAGTIIGFSKTRFNGKDFGVMALDTAATEPTG